MSSYRLEKLRRIYYNAFGLLLKVLLSPELLYKKQLTRFLELPESLQSILILCKGNICRSPYAAERLKSALKSAGLEHISVHSAGLATHNDKPADPQAIITAGIRGIDLTMHRTSIATPEAVSQAGLILVMDPSHLRTLRTKHPTADDRTVLFGAFALNQNFPLTIEDPYGKDPSTFQKRFTQIDAAIESLTQALSKQ